MVGSLQRFSPRPDIARLSPAQQPPAVRILLGVFPVQRLHACVNALTS